MGFIQKTPGLEGRVRKHFGTVGNGIAKYITIPALSIYGMANSEKIINGVRNTFGSIVGKSNIYALDAKVAQKAGEWGQGAYRLTVDYGVPGMIILGAAIVLYKMYTGDPILKGTPARVVAKMTGRGAQIE